MLWMSNPQLCIPDLLRLMYVSWIRWQCWVHASEETLPEVIHPLEECKYFQYEDLQSYVERTKEKWQIYIGCENRKESIEGFYHSNRWLINDVRKSKEGVAQIMGKYRVYTLSKFIVQLQNITKPQRNLKKYIQFVMWSWQFRVIGISQASSIFSGTKKYLPRISASAVTLDCGSEATGGRGRDPWDLLALIRPSDQLLGFYIPRMPPSEVMLDVGIGG